MDVAPLGAIPCEVPSWLFILLTIGTCHGPWEEEAHRPSRLREPHTCVCISGLARWGWYRLRGPGQTAGIPVLSPEVDSGSCAGKQISN